MIQLKIRIILFFKYEKFITNQIKTLNRLIHL